MTEQGSSEASAIQLAHEWVFYFDEPSGKGLERKQYEDSLKPLGSFSTVQEFWRYWNNISVEKFSINSNLRLFKKGIRPSWEDEANERGGRWVIECPPNKVTQTWMLMLLALIGEQFSHAADLCGAVLAIRHRGNTIQLWNKTSNDPALLKKTEADIASLLKLGKLAEMRYQVHKASHDWNQSIAKQQTVITKSVSANELSSMDSSAQSSSAPTIKPAQPASGASLPSQNQDEDDFESPFHELNKEADAKLTPTPPRAAVSTANSLVVESSPGRHRKAHSTGDSSITDLPSVQSSAAAGGDLRPASMTPDLNSKRRLRHRGKRRSSSGSTSLLVPLAFDSTLPPQDEEVENTEESPANTIPKEAPSATPAPLAQQSSSETLARSTDGLPRSPSLSERKYIERKTLQRQQSPDRAKHRRNSSTDSDPAMLNLADAVKRRHFSRGSRDNRRAADTPPYASFCFQVFALFAIALLVAGYFVQYSCAHWDVGCTYE